MSNIFLVVGATYLHLIDYASIMIMSFVDFIALLKSLRKIHHLSSGKPTGHWQHVERIGQQVTLP